MPAIHVLPAYTLASAASASVEGAIRIVKPLRREALRIGLETLLTPRRANTAMAKDMTPAVVGASMRILLAEDNAVNQRVALGNLARLGYNADVASTGVEVLSALEEKRYDIILMDCQMPELDGYGASRAIRRLEGGERHVNIVAMTADAMPGDRERWFYHTVLVETHQPVENK